MQKLEGKLTLVTGAGTGIGREVALEFARQGAAVVLHCASSRSGADSAMAEIHAAGGRAHVIQADLGDVSECWRLVDEAADWLGGLDVLVNNAGVTKRWDFLDVTPEQFDTLYHINIRGQFFCAQRACKHMLSRGGGAIINMTSVHGLASMHGHSVYAGTKGAIVAWTREVALELAPMNIRVNAIAPGWIDVPRNHIEFPDMDFTAAGRTIPRQRLGQPLDIAKACVYLASDDADFVIGSVLVVDGGTMARLCIHTPHVAGS